MNLEHDPDLDPQLRSRLATLADGSNVGTGNLRVIVATARRRTRRRHRAVAGLAVASVATVTAVGVQQLARVAPDANSNVPPPDSTGGTAPATIPVDETPVAASGALPLVPSNITWNKVDVDSTASIGYRSSQNSGAGYAISTAPGESNPDEVTPALYRTEDGISWNLVADDVAWPFSFGNHQFVSSATGVYALGTTAAEAGEPNVLQLGEVGESGEWSIIDLPFDQADFDTTNTLTPVRSSIIPIDNGVLLVLGVPGATPRYELLGEFANGGYHTQRHDGMETTTSEGCDPWAGSRATQANGGDWVEPEFVAATPDTNGSYGDCETEIRTWTEIGLDADDIAAIQRPGRTFAYTVIDGVVSELAVPFEGSAMGSYAGVLMVATSPMDQVGVTFEGDFYRVRPDATFRQVLGHAPADGVTVSASGDAAIAIVYDGGVLYESFATGTTSYRDMSNLLLADGSKPDRIYPEREFVGFGSSFVGLMSLEKNIEQPLSNATSTTVVYELDAAGNTVPATTWADYAAATTAPGYATASTVMPDPNSTRRMLVITDGTTMSAEPVDELIGLPMGSYQVTDVSVVNGQIILTYIQYDNDPDTPNITGVLVGTPNG
ncbi:MAG TPA: hypothetical protein VMM60_01885 [Ilumatobacter sp.]|nr:hypothetical protein [Ilumatobacter sp.]